MKRIRMPISTVADTKPSDPEPDPLENVDYPGDIEGDSRAELDAVQAGFRDRMQRDGDRFRRAVDVNYWTAICFESVEQRDRFLEAVGIEGGQYVDGPAFAAALGVDLSTTN